jgi:hypothetical protein
MQNLKNRRGKSRSVKNCPHIMQIRRNLDLIARIVN